ncbi:GGDEF domain-containing protein [bacterium]|nr:GGDEF domain-containing protein [bacterium]
MIINPTLAYSIIEQIANNDDMATLTDIIKISLSDFFEIIDFNLLYRDEKSGKLLDALNEFEVCEEYLSDEKMSVFNDLSNCFVNLERKFVLNDDLSVPEDVFDTGDYVAKSIALSLMLESKNIGFFRVKLKQKVELSFNTIEFLKTVASVFAMKIQNKMLGKKLDTNLEFYKSMKDIAKIIETQYDYQYIVPLIGEMIDKFVVNHLIYIFIKKDDKFVLHWPNACWNKQVYELMSELSIENKVVLSENRKTGVFGLVGENDLVGCIVAHSTMDRLSDNEIEYISELSAQSSVTLDKANVYSEMLKNATMDALTGLNNRRQFEARLKEQYAIANRQDSPLCAIMTDIDFFKKFNDNYGHSVGDVVLKSTANIVKSVLREYDIPSRYGGEEFCILLPNTSINEAQIVAERLRVAVENSKLDVKSEKTQQNEHISVTISVGLAQLDVRDMPEDLYMKADKALYDAKENGRNRVVVYGK